MRGARASWTALLAALVLAAPVVAQPVAYLQRDGAYWQAWVMEPDGTGARAVSSSAHEKTRVDWFPDQKSLLVSSELGKAYRVDLETGDEQEIPLPLRGTTDAVISPDGTQVAFAVSPASSRDDHEIYLVGLDGSGLRQLTNAPRAQHEPRWHPDGRSLYYISRTSDEAHDIWRATVPGGNLEQLTVGRGLHFDIAVRGDGGLAYSANPSGNYEIWVQLPGKEPRVITHHPGFDGYPTWSPDGKTLLFESNRSGQLEIWRVALDGSGVPEKITTTPSGARHPVWWVPREGSAQ